MNRRVVFASLACLTLLGAGWLLGPQAPAHTEEAKKTPSLRTALEQVVTLDFADVSLEEAAARLRTIAKVPVVLDSGLRQLLSSREAALNLAAGAPPAPSEGEERVTDTTIPPGFSCQLRSMKLSTALDVFLGHYGLGYALQGDTIVIASADKAMHLQQRQPVSLNVANTPLTKALDILSQAASVDVVVDSRCAKEAQTPITIKLTDMALERSLQLAAELADLRTVAVGNTFLVTTPARADALRKSQAKQAPQKSVPIPSPLQIGLGGLGSIDTPERRPALDLFDVPMALLQKGGPAPRGLEPERTVARIVPAVKKELSAAEKMRRKLSEPMPDMKWNVPMTVGEVFDRLENEAGFPRLVINHVAFKAENPDTQPVKDYPVALPNTQGFRKATVLRMVLDAVQSNNAAYLIRPDHIEITTSDMSLPEWQFIEATFQDVPLADALAELADKTGITILVDARAADKAKTLVSGRFQHETNLATAVRLLADMADLKLVVVDRLLYVTLRSNTATFPPGKLPAPSQRVVGAA